MKIPFFKKSPTSPTPELEARYQPLLEPLSDAAPSGVDLEYHPDLLVLQTRTAPQETAQYGDFLAPAENLNWREIETASLALLAKGQDLRVLILLLRCRIQQAGAQGAYHGLYLIAESLQRFGPTLHPQLILDGASDPAVRANVLAALTDHRTVLADLRQIMIDKSAASRLSVRDVERALAIPRMADALQPDSLALQMRSLWAQEHPVIFDLSQAHAQVVRIVAWAQSDLGSDAPDLSALLALLAPFQRDAALHITAQPSIESDQTIHPHSSSRDATPAPVMEPALPTVNTPTSDTPPTSNAMTQTSATPHSRQDALSLVRIARVWFETHEPSSPVADLLRQAEKLTGKSYLEIADAIPLDLLARWRAASHQDT
mgnify:FL=1